MTRTNTRSEIEMHRSARAPLALSLFCFCLLAVGTVSSDVEFVPPEDLEEGWYTRLETEMGRIIVRLLPEQAPQSVASFAGLAEGTLEWIDPVSGERHKNHYYDGLQIDRAEAGRLFEYGRRRGDQGRAPDLHVPREGMGPINFHGGLRMGMTRDMGGQISGVQFVVTYASQPELTDSSPCFGRVVEGKEVILAISTVKTFSNGKPLEPLTIEKIRVFKVGEPAELPALEHYTRDNPEFGIRTDKKRNRY
jgi:peptidyl-prolyl cis-trans isomerase A (cyclophilin A)